MSADITPYTGLITSEHRDQPRFLALVSALVQPLADITALIDGLPQAFDLDTAIGAQLDVVGQWVGRTRNLKTPITGVFFSLDTAGVGFDQGIWWSPYTPTTGIEVLPDDQYRLILRARIMNNQWDGSLEQAYAIIDSIFLSGNAPSPRLGSTFIIGQSPLGYTPIQLPFIQDNADLSMLVGLSRKVPDALTLAMLTQGLLNVRPAGVQVSAYYTVTANAPMFALDIENDTFSGFDAGAWGQPHSPT